MTIETLPPSKMPVGLKQRFSMLWQAAGHPTPETISALLFDDISPATVRAVLNGTMLDRKTFTAIVDALDGDVEEWLGLWDIAAFRILREHQPRKPINGRAKPAKAEKAPTRDGIEQRLREGTWTVEVDNRGGMTVPRLTPYAQYACQVDENGVITLRPIESWRSLPAEELVDIDEAAKILDTTTGRVGYQRRIGKLNAQLLSGSLRFLRADVENLRDELRRTEGEA